MHKQIGKVGTIRRTWDGKACPFCQGYKYELVFRGDTPAQAGALFARCVQCQLPRALNQDFGQMLWM